MIFFIPSETFIEFLYVLIFIELDDIV